MDKSKIQFIRAKLKNDYVYNGIKDKGYDIFTPYYGKNLILRIFREIWFRIKFLPDVVWFNKDASTIDENKKVIIIKDPLIKPEYLKWLRSNNPDKAIILEYENRAKTTINPAEAKPFVTELLSYDKDDCMEYGMTFKPFSFGSIPETKKDKDKDRDVLFVGRDKGRVDHLNNIKKRMEKQGLTVLLYICANRSFQRFNKPYYKKFLDYDEYLEMAQKSNAILNIMPEGQTSITQRDCESILYNIKEITNNKGIKDFEFYDPTRFFILDVDDDNELKKFISSEFKKIPKKELEKHLEENVWENIIGKYL